MKAFIHEGNVERLRKHVQRIAKKAVRYGNDPVSMVLTGVDEYREVTTDRVNVLTGKPIKEVYRFIEVEVNGEAHCDGWRFIATVEHLETGVNVIRRYDTSEDVAIPDRYRTTPPVCEHCGTNRRRKDTYLVYNEDDDTWMQVGKSCLRDLTGGLSAEDVAQWIALWDDVIECEAPGDAHMETYYDIDELLTIAAAVVRVRGFVPTRDDYGMGNPGCTRDMVWYHWKSERGGLSFPAEREMVDWDFRHGYEEKPEDVARIRTWVEDQDAESDYVANLKALLSGNWCKYRDIGLIVSAPHAMIRSEERAAQKRAEAERKRREAASSQWVGAVGERIRIKVDHVRVLTSYETMYGTMFVNAIYDTDGNTYVWKTSRTLRDDVHELVGTVKAHGEFRGVKQTELTRCKVDDGGKR